MDSLNYHHLRYFHCVAHEGHLTRAAEKLNLSQSALSSQIKALEARLGHALFRREGRRLVLTEVGRITLDHADRIFETGRDLMASLRDTHTGARPLRVGALSTLSRNFQIGFLRPALAGGAAISLRSGDADRLMADLGALALDVVLTTEPPDPAPGILTHPIAEQEVRIHGPAARLNYPDLAALLAHEVFILPTEPSIRSGFAGLAARLGVRPRVLAEVDDMAMIRLLAREEAGLAVAPAVVLADEVASKRLATAPFDLGLVERFFAVTVERGFPHPALSQLLAQAR